MTATIEPHTGHLVSCPPDCNLTPMHCYTCGWIGHHRNACPDSDGNANAMPTMTDEQFDRLIPVGTWAYRKHTP